jgi:hypothetical protein
MAQSNLAAVGSVSHLQDVLKQTEVVVRKISARRETDQGAKDRKQPLIRLLVENVTLLLPVLEYFQRDLETQAESMRALDCTLLEAVLLNLQRALSEVDDRISTYDKSSSFHKVSSASKIARKLTETQAALKAASDDLCIRGVETLRRAETMAMAIGAPKSLIRDSPSARSMEGAQNLAVRINVQDAAPAVLDVVDEHTQGDVEKQGERRSEAMTEGTQNGASECGARDGIEDREITQDLVHQAAAGEPGNYEDAPPGLPPRQEEITAEEHVVDMMPQNV